MFPEQVRPCSQNQKFHLVSAIQLYLSLAESHPFFASEATWSQLGYFLCSASPSFWRTKTCTSWTEEPLLVCCPYVFMSSCSQNNLPKWRVYELTSPEDPSLLPSLWCVCLLFVLCSKQGRTELGSSSSFVHFVHREGFPRREKPRSNSVILNTEVKLRRSIH